MAWTGQIRHPGAGRNPVLTEKRREAAFLIEVLGPGLPPPGRKFVQSMSVGRDDKRVVRPIALHIHRWTLERMSMLGESGRYALWAQANNSDYSLTVLTNAWTRSATVSS